jgi:phosphatidate cytidylyltransferase
MAQVSEEREKTPMSSPEPAEPAEPAKKASRAGRDLPAAIAVGLVLGAAILVSLLTVRYLFIGIIAVAIAVGTIEFSQALRRAAGIKLALIPLLVGGQAMVWLTWPFGQKGALIAFALTVLGCLLWRRCWSRRRTGSGGY